MSLAGRIRRRWRWGASAFLVVLVPLASRVASLPDVYQSTAVVLIERPQIPEELVRSTVTSTLETRLEAISQEILSRSSLEHTIEQFGLYQDVKGRVQMEGVIEQMRKDVKIQLTRGQEDGSPVGFSISSQGRDPQKVALVANRLAGLFIEKNLEMRTRLATGTADFLRDQLQYVEQKLREQEKQIGLLKPRQNRELRGQAETNPGMMSREYESTLEMYKSLAVRVREATLALRMEDRQLGEQFRVIETALPSGEPIAPNRPPLYAMALALALVAAAAAILVADAFRRSVARRDPAQGEGVAQG